MNYKETLNEHVKNAIDQEEIRTELDEVKAIREKAKGDNPYLRITQKDKKGRERPISFKDELRAALAAKRRHNS